MSEEPKAPPSAVSRASAATLAAVSTEEPRRAFSPSGQVDFFLGQTIDGRYLIERVIGEGGMGIVYAGRHKVIDKRVAIKVLRGEMAADQDVTERFLQEARAASAIGNPHIIDISDFGHLPDGSTYFVMELLEGRSLAELLAEAKGPLPTVRLTSIAKQIAQGLSAAHAASIVHRDLKPDNVMIVARGGDPNFVKILDFGIAKVGSGTKRMTRAGSVFGTPHYMSPEQAAGAQVDLRTDIYALGVILYEMASGKVPFDADNFMGILTQHMYKAPVPIRALLPDVDVKPGLDAIVLKCLTKKPEGRYATMDELVSDLERLEQGILPAAVQEMMERSGAFNVPSDYFKSGAMPAPAPASPILARRRWPIVGLVGAVASLAVVVGAVALVRTPSSGAQPPPSFAPAAVSTVAPPVPTISEPAPAVTLEPPAPAPQSEVLVTVVPLDATISRDGTNLGQPPLALELANGETAVLSVARKGYKTKSLTVRSDQPKVAVTLEPATPSPAVLHPRMKATPVDEGRATPPTSIDDVGDPFAKH